MNNREYLYQVDRLANGGEPGRPIDVPEWRAPEIRSTRPTAPSVTTGPSASQQYAEYISQQPPSQSPGFVLPSQTFENNAQAYLERNPDVKARYSDAGKEMGLSLYDWARWHYDNYGQMEGRPWEVPAATNAVGFADGGVAVAEPNQPAPSGGGFGSGILRRLTGALGLPTDEQRQAAAQQVGEAFRGAAKFIPEDQRSRYYSAMGYEDPNRPRSGFAAAIDRLGQMGGIGGLFGRLAQAQQQQQLPSFIASPSEDGGFGGILSRLRPFGMPGMAFMSPEARSYLVNQLGSVNMDYLPQAQRDALMRYRQGLERAQDPNARFSLIG